MKTPQAPKLQEPNNANDDPETHFISGKDLADKPVSTYAENENTLIGSLEDKNQVKRANDDQGLPIQLPSQDQERAAVPLRRKENRRPRKRSKAPCPNTCTLRLTDYFQISGSSSGTEVPPFSRRDDSISTSQSLKEVQAPSFGQG